MGSNSAIEWTDHTFNPWWGCAHVSPGCLNCYAEPLANRFAGAASGGRGLWGRRARRRFFPDRHWAAPLRWNRSARRRGEVVRVFCGSMCDWLEALDPEHPDGEELRWTRLRLARLIDETPHLRWLLLTKRPAALDWALGHAWPVGVPDHVWFGVTVENQDEAGRRLPPLLAAPVRRRFVSCEPLLGPVDLSWAVRDLDWVIGGCESGPAARTAAGGWFAALAAQCEGAGVPFFLKQQMIGGRLVKRPDLRWVQLPKELEANAKEPTM